MRDWKTIRIAAVLVGLSFIIFLAPGRAAAERFPVLLSEQDRSLAGVAPSNISYFTIPSYWTVNGASIKLDYQASQLSKKEQSSVTLLMNGTPFHSFRPIVEGDTKQSLTVAIPQELLVKGPNELTVQGGIRTLDEEPFCSPDEWRDNWFWIYKTTEVDIDYALKPLDGTIRHFYERFVGTDTFAAARNIVAIPEHSENAELESAVHALSGFTKAGAVKDRALALESFAESRWNGKPYAVAIALHKNLPTELQSLLTKQDWSKTASIQVVKRENQHVLVVTSDQPSLLVKAGKLLANGELAGQLDRPVKIVDESTDVFTPAVVMNRTMKLTETGAKLTGVQHQEHSFFISLPANRTVSDSSKIKLDFRYAKNLDFDRSLVTLLIDGKPIGSKKLTSEAADGDTLTLPIPKNANIAGNFSIVAAFDLELKSGYCIRNQEQMPWAYVTHDSMLQLNTIDSTDLLFDNYPFPFLRDGMFNDVAVVLPKERDRHIYQAVSNVFGLLGQYAEGNRGDVRFYSDDENPELWRGNHIVAIGSFKSHAVIREANDKMFFKFDAEGRGFTSNEKMSVDFDYGTRLGTLQLLESPYKPGNGLLVVAGGSTPYAELASGLIAEERNRWKVWGDAVTVDRDGFITAHRFKLQAEAEPETIVGSLSERTDVLGFLAASALVLILVLISLILLIRKYRKKRGNGNEA
ncbi:cellulose biosynthesis cyclic di-GMP-binding regulatory protein BcsB [Paenibacillus sp. GCM10027627]|uniref:cellulose biosynthesis cyclic di-GMP-binding regulatory protein BcsB n=1 Tax=unclassified Paenibacillus TaxID=185978 RepID=UPI003630C221